MSQGTQTVNSRDSGMAAAAVLGFNPASTVLQYQSSLLRLWPGNAVALLLRYQSSLLRLSADNAPRPLFQYQSSLLKLWADGCELVARSYEQGSAALSRTVEEQQGAEAVGTSAKTPLRVAGDQAKAAMANAPGPLKEAGEPASAGANAETNKGGKPAKAIAKKIRPMQKAASRKRMATKTMKRGEKKGR